MFDVWRFHVNLNWLFKLVETEGRSLRLILSVIHAGGSRHNIQQYLRRSGRHDIRAVHVDQLCVGSCD